jgi:predicted ATPase
MRSRPADREPFYHSVRMMWDEVESKNRFPFSIPAFRHLDVLNFHPAVTFLIGENGSGKSTLLEAIAVRLDFEETGGDARSNFGRRALDGGLHDAIRIKWSNFRRPADRFFLRAETVFNMATELDQEAKEDARALQRFGGKSLHKRSHGEAFLAIVQNRMKQESFFLLDEPEAALSPSRQLTAIQEIDWLVRAGCQFIIATHSPILLAYPDSVIYELGDHGIREVLYEETEHYTLTKAFLDHPQAFLRHLVE